MRTKKTFINFLTDVVPLIISSLLGIFKLKLFIQILGDETLGLYQLFTQIMIYVALVDGNTRSSDFIHYINLIKKRIIKKLVLFYQLVKELFL